MRYAVRAEWPLLSLYAVNVVCVLISFCFVSIMWICIITYTMSIFLFFSPFHIFAGLRIVLRKEKDVRINPLEQVIVLILITVWSVSDLPR